MFLLRSGYRGTQSGRLLNLRGTPLNLFLRTFALLVYTGLVEPARVRLGDGVVN